MKKEFGKLKKAMDAAHDEVSNIMVDYLEDVYDDETVVPVMMESLKKSKAAHNAYFEAWENLTVEDAINLGTDIDDLDNCGKLTEEHFTADELKLIDTVYRYINDTYTNDDEADMEAEAEISPDYYAVLIKVQELQATL